MKHRTPPKPLSARQLAANRANARNSTGPRTPEGKAIVSKNAITHGITSRGRVLSCEDQAEYDNTAMLLRREFAPRGATEELLFEEILQVQWEQRRLRGAGKFQLEITIQDPKLVDNFESAEGAALIALAHKHLSDHSNVLQVLNRQCSRLSREFHRLVSLYIQLHGPIQPVPPEPEIIAGQNKPIPETEQVELEVDTGTQRPLTSFFRHNPVARVIAPQPDHPPEVQHMGTGG